MSEAPTPSFVTVAAVYSRVELTFLLGLLRAHDIWAVPLADQHHHIDWPLAVALGGVELRVRPEQAADARALLATIERQVFRGGIFTSNRLLDIALALMIFLYFWTPPPARIPAIFYLEERA